MEMMNAIFKEDAKSKAHALHVQVVGWGEKGIPQEDAKNLRTAIDASNIPLASTWRLGRDDSRVKVLTVRFMDMKRRKLPNPREGH